MESKFNRFDFEQVNIEGKHTYIDGRGMHIKQWVNLSKEEYGVETSDPVIPAATYKIYYMDTCNLKMLAEKFYNFNAGTWKYFNERGDIIKEINYDLPFAFTIRDLDSKLKKMDIDIMLRSSRILVTRCDTPYPYYKVHSPVEANSKKIITLVIDGTNGEIMARHEGVIRLN